MKDYLELLSSVGKLKKIQKNSILFYEGEDVGGKIKCNHRKIK